MKTWEGGEWSLNHSGPGVRGLGEDLRVGAVAGAQVCV